MELPGYNIEWNRVISEAKTATHVTIRLPVGLFPYASRIADYIHKKTGTPISISANSCYGACDYPLMHRSFMKKTGEKIFHFGDAPMPSLGLPPPILFFEATSRCPITSGVNQALDLLEGNNIGVVTSTPWVHTLHTCTDILANRGYHPVIGKPGKRAAHDGQVLGCDLTAATTLSSRIDSYLYIGDGTFHPLGVALATQKPVITVDPYQNQVKKQEIAILKEKILRQRSGALARASDAYTYGIIICSKMGQHRPQLAHYIQETLEKKRKKAYQITVDEVSPAQLDPLKMDCYISTACPRIAIDDYLLYKKPILTPIELEIHLQKRDWATYEFDQIS